MITGLPAYKPPIVEDVHCLCRAYYRVFVGVEDYQSVFAEKEAAMLGAIFIDARRSPFVTCARGQTLDFSPECTMTVQ